MTTFAKLILAGVIVFALLQLVRPAIPAKPATAEIQAPPEVKQMLEKDCYSCHSDRAAARPGLIRSCPATGWCGMTF